MISNRFLIYSYPLKRLHDTVIQNKGENVAYNVPFCHIEEPSICYHFALFSSWHPECGFLMLFRTCSVRNFSQTLYFTFYCIFRIIFFWKICLPPVLGDGGWIDQYTYHHGGNASQLVSSICSMQAVIRKLEMHFLKGNISLTAPRCCHHQDEKRCLTLID